MDAKEPAEIIAGIAAAIGEAPRARMLYCLLDGRARTATELAIVADVTPSTASAHLQRLMKERLIQVLAQGKHRYYSLSDSNVADALEKLGVIAGSFGAFCANTPSELREARACYDHMAGRIGVALRTSFQKMLWLTETSKETDHRYDLTPKGADAMEALGIDVRAIRKAHRRFAYGCMDWSERQPHIGGALGAAILKIALKRKWMIQELDSRALNITRTGKRELHFRFGIEI
jgi:DNA-binding transcriptional ArsR family regulator